MTEHKHTPGPLGIGRRCGSIIADNPSGHDDERNVETYSGHLVCESVMWGANANLITAAPDILESLEMIVEDGNQGLDYDIYMKCRAAIAKAKGEI